ARHKRRPSPGAGRSTKKLKGGQAMSRILSRATHRALAAACAAAALGAAAAAAQAASFEVLHRFNHADGCYPDGALALAPDGRLYGTTSWYGPHAGGGTVFALDGTTYTVLYNFSGVDGREPLGKLAVDRSGIIYGTTYVGGLYDMGVVYRLDPAS